MTTHSDLADTVTTIMALHMKELIERRPPQGPESEPPDPNSETANQIWHRLTPYLENNDALKEKLLILTISPGEITKLAVKEELVRLFIAEPALKARIEDYVSHSPYSGLSDNIEGIYSISSTLVSRAERRKYTIRLVAGTVLSWMLASYFSQENIWWAWIVLLILQGVLVAHCAKGLKVKQPTWLGVGAVLPGNLGLILAAVLGYQVVTRPSGKETIRYAQEVKVIAAGLAIVPPLAFAFFSATNPEYMAVLYSDKFGNYLLAAALFAYALLLLSSGLGFWYGKAKTGIGIAIASTIASWTFVFLMWFILLGPAIVRVLNIINSPQWLETA
jgi:hypothetical protein